MKLKRTVLADSEYADFRDSDQRPEHQLERGKRHGNNRKMYANLKVVGRRHRRAAEKDALRRMEEA